MFLLTGRQISCGKLGKVSVGEEKLLEVVVCGGGRWKSLVVAEEKRSSFEKSRRSSIRKISGVDERP